MLFFGRMYGRANGGEHFAEEAEEGLAMRKRMDVVMKNRMAMYQYGFLTAGAQKPREDRPRRGMHHFFHLA